MPEVECLNVALAEPTHCTGKPSGSLRRKQQMDMVVHEHEGVQGDVAGLECVAKETPKVVPIFIVQEDRALVDTTLGDVQRYARQQQSRCPWHD